MRYQLINQPDEKLSTIQQILYNRGISKEELPHYLNLSREDVNSFTLLGEENLKKGLSLIVAAVAKNEDTIIVVDCDTDGYTSAAILINYLYKLFPTWVKNHLRWIMHEGKQHGLSDCIDYILSQSPALVLLPDSSSNDYEQHTKLKEAKIQSLVLDHHLADHISKDAVIINNQLSNYPNKEFSGAGVVWQFCRYADSKLNTDYANDFLDLVATGLTGDMMSLHSFQTRYLIAQGFKKDNIKNPFIEYMLDKNNFSLSKADYVSNFSDAACTPMGAAFFVIPFINAITRSGTIEEKNVVFSSMLNHLAFQKVLSTKRGHRQGEEELRVLQAIRVATNVKNRQTKAEKEGLERLEGLIKQHDMLSHKALLFLLEPGEVNSGIRGLIANKFMAKYQRPCCILTKTVRDDIQRYEGSARGYTKTGVQSFKNIISQCPGVIYAQGHHNAFGLGIYANQIKDFLAAVDLSLENISSQPLYRVDYLLKEYYNNTSVILSIAEMNDYWGQDIDRAYVLIRFTLTDKNFFIMKNNTLKFVLPNNLSIIKFNGTQEQIENFTVQESRYKTVCAICKCNQNKFNGNIYPQLFLQDYDIEDEGYLF